MYPSPCSQEEDVEQKRDEHIDLQSREKTVQDQHSLSCQSAWTAQRLCSSCRSHQSIAEEGSASHQHQHGSTGLLFSNGACRSSVVMAECHCLAGCPGHCTAAAGQLGPAAKQLWQHCQAHHRPGGGSLLLLLTSWRYVTAWA